MSSQSQSEVTEIQSVLERLIGFRNFLLGFTTVFNSDHPIQDSTDDQNRNGQRDRIILINPLTQGMVVFEGMGLDALFRNYPEKEGNPPASKSVIDAMPSVEIGEGDEGDCAICLDEFSTGLIVKEMPCKHRFHGECIEKWLRMHGSCPLCRHVLPAEEEEGGKKQGEEREDQGRVGRREVWVGFSFGDLLRRMEERDAGIET